MHLLERKDDGSFIVTEWIGETPRYAILSHTWGEDREEVTYKDVLNGTGQDKRGYEKLRFCGRQATTDALKYFWVDTCCIDKSSSAELSEAINSMYRWYKAAAKCYVYLSDISVDRKQFFKNSRWFTRGWTLQELIAPESVEFFSVEGERLGDKTSLLQDIHNATGISSEVLQQTKSLSQISIEDKMSWAKARGTKRPEDRGYCLLGLFDVHMPLIYGEGQNNAFTRLEQEIRKSFDGMSSLKKYGYCEQTCLNV
jgi:hypothetical protein